MLLIGKLGARKTEGNFREMTELEQLIASQDELRAYWRQRFYDASVYAPNECFGKVARAYFEVEGKPRTFLEYEQPFGVAVVEIESQ
jgi:hypothetical protein